jgi:hypothetical protein
MALYIRQARSVAAARAAGTLEKLVVRSLSVPIVKSMMESPGCGGWNHPMPYFSLM